MFKKEPKKNEKICGVKLQPLHEVMLSHNLILMGFDPYGDPVNYSTDVFQLRETEKGLHSFTFVKTGYRVEWEQPNFGMFATHDLNTEILSGHIRLCIESVQNKRNQTL